MFRLTYPARAALLAALFVGPLLGRAVEAQVAPPFVPGRVLVQFRSGVTAARIHELLAAAGGQSARQIPHIGVHIVQLPSQANPTAVARAFGQQREVAFAEPDYVLRRAGAPNDPNYPDEWHLPKIAAPAAWNSTTGSESVTIAVCDTGVDGTHPDLAPKVVPGWNFYDNNADASDVDGHGTGVAGAATACSNNGIGVASVAWGCRIMPVRITDPSGTSNSSTLASGIIWAADHGARVANASFGLGTIDSATLTNAAQYMQGKGGVVICAEGNSGTFSSLADNPYLLHVSATDSIDALTTWTTTGNNVDLAAPGVNIYTTVRGGLYGLWSGTSLSTPIVSGVAALVISANPGLSGAQVRDILEQSADDLGSAGWDPGYGWGRVNAARAVSLASGGAGTGDTTPPTVSFASPAAGATVSGTLNIQVNASDNVGVASVSLTIDSSILGTSVNAPCSFTCDTTRMSNGSHTLTAIVTDAAGNTASTQVSITVSNPVPDTTPPTVSFSSPTAGATVSGTISVAVSAGDNVAISSVSLTLDGAPLGTDTSAPYNFTWNTTGWANGSHTLTATASDTSSNAGISSLAVIVGNSTADIAAPTIGITSPTAGARVSGTIPVLVNTADNLGVVKVELYVDGKLAATATTAPFTTKWNANKAKAGAHTLQCKAYDAARNVGASPAVTVYR